MKKISLILALMISFVITSCGDEKKEEEKITIGDNNTFETIDTEEATMETDTAAAATDTLQREEGVVEVQLTGDDQMKFNLKEIKVKAGQTVKLTLKHVGQLEENVMGHNFVLLKQGTDLAKFAQQAASAKSNDYIPQNTDKVIANTEMIGGGEETTIEFKAPAAGTYDFICSFPGHYIQMQGKFIVE
ncbi:azurin [Salinimicrobium catena]|uniref:Azurin n=1 Tax=Salinimicrobium catena TaxID=390640 RepID=A0A1H5N1C1_9FLAO|nr:azurin [Salinimicrobium catena]SDL33267.1 azurin [Salinimicrobium catena]SEE94747.1 azurin [Salinimicrobium catena]